MSGSDAKLETLAEGSQKSLRNLLSNAIAPEGTSSSNGKLSGNVVDKLAEKLSELLGPEAVQGLKQGRNERGELVNEEGLPIIDITEPVDIEKPQSTASLPTPVSVEPLIPLATLPTSAQQRLRDQRNRILDLLEAEEDKANALEQQRESEEREELLRTRKEQSENERDRLKAAKELQKKMGRALLQDMGRAKEKERQEEEAQRLRDEEAETQRKSPSIKKKNVAFVDSLEDTEKEGEAASESVDWGDVTPARLRTTKRPTLMSQALLDRHPMKMSVVERVPGGQATVQQSFHRKQQPADSDDESNPPSDLESSGTEVDEDDDEVVLEKDDVDFDFAQHQREIALEYLRKRNTIGAEAASAMMNHSHDDDEHLGSAPELMNDTAKPALSQFRANRIASAYNASTPPPSTSISSSSPSTSLGASVIPASSARTIQRAVRTGKLDSDGKLVGTEGDSASEEEDQGLQEVLELLQKGEVYNIGPDGKYLHTIPPRSTPWGSTSSQTPLPSANPDDTPNPSTLPPSSGRSKTSKFKASLAAAGRPTPSNAISIPLPAYEPLSASSTPVSHEGRSSPKMGTLRTPTNSTVTERNPPAVQSSSVFSPSAGNPPLVNSSMPFSMIVDSPSFSAPREPQSRPTMPSMIVSSPSFPPVPSSRRPDRPPAVISSTVRESSATRMPQHTEAHEGRPEKKVSRFKAERS
ncbi:hypothetical protein B0H34DRAFT_328733 [Crassisporium funariophilum]|nr:hypothetical protein B0H34DRAFT_328733 [Crassisporium funariophilum]